jgi:hypothetical protein
MLFWVFTWDRNTLGWFLDLSDSDHKIELCLIYNCVAYLHMLNIGTL